jgi:hypothetical protein
MRATVRGPEGGTAKAGIGEFLEIDHIHYNQAFDIKLVRADQLADHRLFVIGVNPVILGEVHSFEMQDDVHDDITARWATDTVKRNRSTTSMLPRLPTAPDRGGRMFLTKREDLSSVRRNGVEQRRPSRHAARAFCRPAV